jgi:hypothetical protein
MEGGKRVGARRAACKPGDLNLDLFPIGFVDGTVLPIPQHNDVET